MREIRASHITDTVARLCVEANRQLPQDVRSRICAAYADEPWPIAKEVLGRILENADIAAELPQPICQDTGMACVFVELGQEVHIAGDLNEAIHAGVRRGYTDGFLRKSVVRDPLDRVNTGDNTPAMIYYEIVPGDRLKLTVAPKGFGSENMSRIAMLRPSDGLDGVKQLVLDAVLPAGPNPCPPLVVGVGLGGTFDKAALLAKKALLRETGGHNEDPFYAELERELLERIKNGGKLEGKDFRPEDKDREARKERYSEYAERMLKEAVEGCFDWSIFEKPIVPFDGASGTQTLIHGLGQAQNTLFC